MIAWSRPAGAPIPIVLAFLAAAAPAASLAAGDGLRVSGGLTAVFQVETDGDDDDTSLSGDLRFRLPTASGGWLLYVEGATGTDADSVFALYPEVNADAGSVFDSDGGSHVQVSEFSYRFDLDARSQLTVGQVDPSAQIDRSQIANDENTQFLGSSFKNNATIDFPDYTIGAIYRRAAADRVPELTLMLTSSKGIADLPTRSYRELVAVSDPGRGIFGAAGLRWLLGPTEIGVGAWTRTDERPRIEDPAATDNNYGAWATLDHDFGSHALNLRAGIANDGVSRVGRFGAVAWRLKFGRQRLGLGIARIIESSSARHAASGDTNHVEAWYRMPLAADRLHGSISVQYLDNPGFDRSRTLAEAHALVAGLRLDFVF